MNEISYLMEESCSKNVRTISQEYPLTYQEKFVEISLLLKQNGNKIVAFLKEKLPFDK